MSKFNSWPSGKLLREFQRPELDIVKTLGYEWNDPRDVVDRFERKVAEFAGAKYGVAVDCCTNGLFLCLKYLNASGVVEIPKHTYQSVPMNIIHAGCTVDFRSGKEVVPCPHRSFFLRGSHRVHI